MLVTFRLAALGFGGTERVFLSVADFLSSTYGWQIDFVVDKIRGHETEQIALNKGYRVVGLDMPRTWKTILPFARYLKERCPDIVFSAYTETNAAALIANALNRFHTPIIVTEHASLDEHWAEKPWLRKMLLEFMVRYVYKLADRVVCVSRGMAEQLGRRLNHPHISYIYNPVRFALRTQSKEEARQSLGVNPDTQMILAVGRICRQKNYLMLLEAIKSLQMTNKFCLYIVGGVYEADEKERIDRFVAENNLVKKVNFVDFTHDVQSYYEAADLLVLSSAWEGFGNVLVEALAYGLPIVSSRCNYGPAEILADGEFGVLVAVNDYVAMGQAIQQVLEQNPFDSMGQIQRAKEFSEQRIGEVYHRLICETKSCAASC
jgi:glycosyltransferase involved in cell wall biosynthesis